MAKSAVINMRVEPEIKAQAEHVFGDFGMSLADAINIFLHKSIMEGGLPFDVRQPRYNAQTEAAIKEARGIMDGSIHVESFDSASEMLNALLED